MAGNQPAAGDIIIAPDTSSGRGFTLSVAPDGPCQLWYPAPALQCGAMTVHPASTAFPRATP